MSDLVAQMDALQGWLGTKEGLFLRDRASEVRDGCIVEIGCFRGKSAIALAHGAPDGVTVYTIDPHEQHTDEIGGKFGPQDRVAFCQQILDAGVADKIAPINLYSWQVSQVWNKPIALLFVDGAHNYPAVMDDFAQWSNFIVNGGKVLFHDSTWPDIQQVIQHIKTMAGWQFKGQYHSISILERDRVG